MNPDILCSLYESQKRDEDNQQKQMAACLASLAEMAHTGNTEDTTRKNCSTHNCGTSNVGIFTIYGTMLMFTNIYNRYIIMYNLNYSIFSMFFLLISYSLYIINIIIHHKLDIVILSNL